MMKNQRTDQSQPGLLRRHVRRLAVFAVIATTVVGLTAIDGEAGSLWFRRKPQRVYLFRDTKARRVGDLVTVLIQENTDVINRDSRSLAKDSGSGFNFSFAQSTGGDFGSAASDASGSGNASSNRSFSGGAEYQSDRGFNDRFTARVVQVYPNGDLRISGQRDVLVEGDHRTLTLTGVVRGLDLRSDNTVLSNHVADMNLRYQGQGIESRFVNQGWISRGLNKIWPF